ADRAANKEGSCCTRARTAAIKLSSQRSRRRETTRRNRPLAAGPARINSTMPRVVKTRRAMANKANNPDQAIISLTRAWAKPRYHFVSRNPSSQEKRRPYSWAARLARQPRLLTRYHVSH